MDSLTNGPGGPRALGAPGAPALPAGVSDADTVRLFGAAYRMLGSACGAREAVRNALDAEGEGLGGEAADDPYGRLVREVFGALLRRGEPLRPRRDGHAPTAAWLPEPVLTAGGALGPLDTDERRGSVSMARLVLLERLGPAERAAYVLDEAFGYTSARAAGVLDVPEARYQECKRRASHRIREAEGAAPYSREGAAQRGPAVAELLRAIREEDRAALEELLADDVVAWSDGGGKPGVVRRPVLGAVKVGRLLGTVRERIPPEARGEMAEVNGDVALLAVADAEIVGVLAPEFGPQGMVGIRAVADPARLVFINGQWAGRADRPGGARPAG